MPHGSGSKGADHEAWWQARIGRQQEIDAAIAQAADVELLYDRPYLDPGRVRVAGPFTVESLSPHRIAAADETELADDLDAAEGKRRRTGTPQVDFSQIVIDYLKSAGIHQSDKSGKIDFYSMSPWPGRWIGAEGRFQERDEMRRAAILIGPEYGTVSRPDLTAAAREANEAGFDMLIACEISGPTATNGGPPWKRRMRFGHRDDPLSARNAYPNRVFLAGLLETDIAAQVLEVCSPFLYSDRYPSTYLPYPGVPL